MPPYLQTTHISTWPVFCRRVFGVLSVLLEWQNHFMQTGEHLFMQTLDWCQLDWQGMNAKEKLGASYPAAPRCRHIKERSEAFWYRGEDSRTSFNPGSSPQCVFVDYCLVFPRRMPHRRWAADKLTKHTSGYLFTLAERKGKSKQKLCQMFAGTVTQGLCTAEKRRWYFGDAICLSVGSLCLKFYQM